jgi:Domain of unknown function (DUF4276)
VRVFFYVEGPSDRDGLAALLRPIVYQGQKNGVGVRFLAIGDKAAVLRKVPRMAADHLVDHPLDRVIAAPDLYPMAPYAGTADAHSSFEDLERLLQQRFTARADKVGLVEAARGNFRVHCLKHDLEALLLAAREQLRQRLGTGDELHKAWRQPVEDQNDDQPPKRVVEKLFDKYRKKPGYVDTTDAPWILARANLAEVEKACPQRFGPFVTELREAASKRTG